MGAESAALWKLCGFLMTHFKENDIQVKQPNRDERFDIILFNRSWGDGGQDGGYLNWPELVDALNQQGHELDLGEFRFDVFELVRFSNKKVEGRIDFREMDASFSRN